MRLPERPLLCCCGALLLTPSPPPSPPVSLDRAGSGAATLAARTHPRHAPFARARETGTRADSLSPSVPTRAPHPCLPRVARVAQRRRSAFFTDFVLPIWGRCGGEWHPVPENVNPHKPNITVKNHYVADPALTAPNPTDPATVAKRVAKRVATRVAARVAGKPAPTEKLCTDDKVTHI